MAKVRPSHFTRVHLGEGQAVNVRCQSQLMHEDAPWSGRGVVGCTDVEQALDAESDYDSDSELAAILAELDRGLRRVFLRQKGATTRSKVDREDPRRSPPQAVRSLDADSNTSTEHTKLNRTPGCDQ